MPRAVDLNGRGRDIGRQRATSGAKSGEVRASPDRPSPLDTIELYRNIAEDREIRIEATVPSDLSLTADRTRMRQVIANMLDNALKYTARGGRVALTAYAANAQIVIVLEDTGIGIAPTDLPRIWDRLYRGDPGRTRRGLGLGLSLVRAIVHAHHGRVNVSSEPGKGSRFTLFFPATSPFQRSREPFETVMLMKGWRKVPRRSLSLGSRERTESPPEEDE